MSWELKAFKLTLWLDTDLAIGAFDELELDVWKRRVFEMMITVLRSWCKRRAATAVCTPPSWLISIAAIRLARLIIGFSITPDKATAVFESIRIRD